jgi:molybdate/tungstate transport system substrate-binding protein
LGNYRFDDFYARAKVQVTGNKPGTWITQTGKSCTYGIALVKAAPNREAALAFLNYMLDAEGGLKVLDRMGQPPFIPCRVPDAASYDRLPDVLKTRVEIKN